MITTQAGKVLKTRLIKLEVTGNIVSLTRCDASFTLFLAVLLSLRLSRSIDFVEVSEANSPGQVTRKRLIEAKYRGLGTRQMLVYRNFTTAFCKTFPTVFSYIPVRPGWHCRRVKSLSIHTT